MSTSRFNDNTMVCTCHEEVSSVVFIPQSEKLVISIKKVTLDPDGKEIANDTHNEEAIVPEDANLLELLLSYRIDNDSLDPNINTPE